MKTMCLQQAVMIVSILLAGCAPNTPSVEEDAHPRIPALDAIGDVGNVGECSVSVESVYCWRDWQPLVETPGKDGGSPLYVKTNLQVDNSNGPATELSWNAYAFEVVTGTYYPIDLLDKNGDLKWYGQMRGSEARTVELMTHDGPYLHVGIQIVLVFRIEDQSGQTLWVKSKESRISRTD